MRCPNVRCRAELLPEDRHCPLCGTAVDASSGGSQTQTSPDAIAALQPQRVTADEAPPSVIVERGEAYPALRDRAHVAIATGSFLRWVLSALGLVLCVLTIIAAHGAGHTLLGFIIGILLLAAGIVIGWLIWLRMAVTGEMVYLILDMADTFRRGYGRREQ